ncbi:MAG: preprotein translocase subunit SecE [Clostridia bacterium]|nr:preprotein translocase subunit SecE [Clostridia bacterium]
MAEEKKGNIFKRIGRFFKDVKAELKKVTWPTKNQAVKNTVVVLIFLIVIGLFVFLIDSLFQGAAGFIW